MADGIYGDCHSHYWLEDMATRVIHDTGNPQWSSGDVTDKPCPTVMLSHSHFHVRSDNQPEKLPYRQSSKPPYCVPSMAEIAAIPWNSFKVVSTFSGCGGSCLGYRMAGFRVIWANEFLPAAQDSYRANAAESSVLDGRDIRIVKPEEILAATGLKKGELDLFDGSPPCQAFSTAGQRDKGWGRAKEYENGATQCNETLFSEYVRILRGLMPKVFVAENVSGLVKGVSKGWFLDVLKALKESGYRVKAKLLDAQWLGVPQMRQRIIFMGVREDLGLEPVHPEPLPYRYSVREAIPWLSRMYGGQKAAFDAKGVELSVDKPNRSVLAKLDTGGGTQFEVETDIAHYAIAAEWDRMKPGEKSEKYLNLVKPDPDKPCVTVTALGGSNPGIASVTHPIERRKFTIAELKRICAFPDDFILTGSYAQQWERLGNSVPPLMMKAVAEKIRDEVLAKC